MNSQLKLRVDVFVGIFLGIGSLSDSYGGSPQPADEWKILMPASIRQLWKGMRTSHPGFQIPKKRDEYFDKARAATWSNLIPQIEGGAVFSSGNFGAPSQGLLNGDLSASQRSGEGVGLYARYQIYDFGRTTAMLELVESQRALHKVEDQIEQSQLAQSFLQEIFYCALSVSRGEVLAQSAIEAEKQEITIRKLVQTGQRTQVEAHLTRAALLEIQTEREENSLRQQYSKARIEAMAKQAFQNCPSLAQYSMNPIHADEVKQTTREERLLRLGRSLAAEALGRDGAVVARKEYLPRIQLLGNFGAYFSERLNSPWHYSVSAVLQVPIFDGLKTPSEVGKAEVDQEIRKAKTESERLKIAQWRSSLEERLLSLQKRRNLLELERLETSRGYEVAARRFKSAEGSVTDLREAMRNRLRVELRYLETQAEYLVQAVQPAIASGNLSLLE